MCRSKKYEGICKEQVAFFKAELEATRQERQRLLDVVERRLLPPPVEENPKPARKPVARKKPEPVKAPAKATITKTPKVKAAIITQAKARGQGRKRR